MAETREAVLNIAGKDIKVAVCNTLKSAKEMLKKIKDGKADYQFIEVMACPGGRIGGMDNLFLLIAILEKNVVKRY